MLCNQVEWQKDEKGQYQMVNVPDTDFEIQADLVVLAMGFESVIHEGLADAFGLKYNGRSNIAVDANHMTSVDGVFAPGDATRGASFVVWAIQQVRETPKLIASSLNRPAM